MSEPCELQKEIKQDIIHAMKSKASLKLATLRMLSSEIKNKEIETRLTLNKQELLTLIRKMIKQRQDSITLFEAGNRIDLADKERQEIKFLQPYLPPAIDAATLAKAIDHAIASVSATSMKDMGLVVKFLKKELSGSVDFGQVSALIKAKLT